MMRLLPGSSHSRRDPTRHVASEVAKGVAKVELDSGIPVIFGVITADTIEQAIERAGTKLEARAGTLL